MAASRIAPQWLLVLGLPLAIGAQAAGVTSAPAVASASAVADASAVASTPAATSAPAVNDSYIVQPGDTLQVSVWKETDLQSEVLVRPDGGMTFPLAGNIDAGGHTVDEIRSTLVSRLSKYIPDPVVTVAVKLTTGSRIFVVGKVNRPGDFPLIRPIDVMQALSLAGGATAFAHVDSIRILRRDNGRQLVFRFRYDDVRRGRELSQNILLQSGDTVVVP